MLIRGIVGGGEWLETRAQRALDVRTLIIIEPGGHRAREARPRWRGEDKEEGAPSDSKLRGCSARLKPCHTAQVPRGNALAAKPALRVCRHNSTRRITVHPGFIYAVAELNEPQAQVRYR